MIVLNKENIKGNSLKKKVSNVSTTSKNNIQYYIEVTDSFDSKLQLECIQIAVYNSEVQRNVLVIKTTKFDKVKDYIDREIKYYGKSKTRVRTNNSNIFQQRCLVEK